jgi:hypothetical protein
VIRRAIQYSAPAKAVIAQFNLMSDDEKKKSFWESPAAESVRKEVKQHYIKEQGYCCCYCAVSIPSQHGRAWDVEHIIPRSTHPEYLFEPENLAAACIECNNEKRDKPVLTSRRRRTFPRNPTAYRICHPHYDRLEDHLVIMFERFFFPKTDKGRQTIEICGLLRYAYKYAEWDAGLASNERLLEALNRAMNATECEDQKLAIMEALVLAGLPFMRS